MAAKTDSIEIDLMLIPPFIFRYGSCWHSSLSAIYFRKSLGTSKCGVYVSECVSACIQRRRIEWERGRLCTHNFHPEKQSILQSKQVLRVSWKIFYNVYYVCQGCATIVAPHLSRREFNCTFKCFKLFIATSSDLILDFFLFCSR